MTGLSRQFVEVHPFPSNHEPHSFIIYFRGVSAAAAVCTFGEHVRNDDSPLHLLPELRDIYSRAVFRVIGNLNRSQPGPAPEISDSCTSRSESQPVALRVSAAPGTDATAGFRTSGIPLKPDANQFNHAPIVKDSSVSPHRQVPMMGCAYTSAASQALSPRTGILGNQPMTSLGLSRHIIVSIPAHKPTPPRCHGHPGRRLRLHRTPLTQVTAVFPVLPNHCNIQQGSKEASDGKVPVPERIVNLSIEQVTSVTISPCPPRLSISNTFRSIEILEPVVELVRPQPVSLNQNPSKESGSDRGSARGGRMFESKVERSVVESRPRELSDDSESPIYVIRKTAKDLWND